MYIVLSAVCAWCSERLMLLLTLYLAQGTTIKPLVRLIHLRLARTRKETLNESVHTAVSSTATTFTYILRRFCMVCALYVLCELGYLSLLTEKLLSQGLSDQIRACFNLV